MLEKMGAFFDRRLNGYDEHMMTAIEGAVEFYKFTAAQLPSTEHCAILDLGCGTGLELEEYFSLNPFANITGIDLSKGMLSALKQKFPEKTLELICGSYFDIPLGRGRFDAAVSVESLHHFTKEEKIPLYQKLYRALKPGGFFILTDYFSENEEEEAFYQAELSRLKALQGITGGEFYHYDTPLTVKHEMEALSAAGFSSIEVLKHWSATCTMKAVK